MIEVTIYMEVLPEKRPELIQTLRSMTEEIRSQTGCKNCYFYQDVENEDIFILHEEWKSREELDSHLKSDMLGALIGTKSLLVEPADFHIRKVSHIEGLEAVRRARGDRHV